MSYSAENVWAKFEVVSIITPDAASSNALSHFLQTIPLSSRDVSSTVLSSDQATLIRFPTFASIRIVLENFLDGILTEHPIAGSYVPHKYSV